jgi:hypothetical protein
MGAKHRTECPSSAIPGSSRRREGKSFAQTSRKDMPSARVLPQAKESESIGGQNERIKKTKRGQKSFFELLKVIAIN